jgi:hypothetical protein
VLALCLPRLRWWVCAACLSPCCSLGGDRVPVTQITDKHLTRRL